jgi:hypothetical protein
MDTFSAKGASSENVTRRRFAFETSMMLFTSFFRHRFLF